jgi:hypothetical protein
MILTYYSYVAISGFCTSDRDPWTLQERFWLEDWLKQDETRVLLVGNRLNKTSSFEDLLREGENLLRVVERYRSSTNVRSFLVCFVYRGSSMIRFLSYSIVLALVVLFYSRYVLS